MLGYIASVLIPNHTSPNSLAIGRAIRAAISIGVVVCFVGALGDLGFGGENSFLLEALSLLLFALLVGVLRVLWAGPIDVSIGRLRLNKPNYRKTMGLAALASGVAGVAFVCMVWWSGCTDISLVDCLLLALMVWVAVLYIVSIPLLFDSVSSFFGAIRRQVWALSERYCTRSLAVLLSPPRFCLAYCEAPFAALG